jgi:hypothetical protein
VAVEAGEVADSRVAAVADDDDAVGDSHPV